MIRKIAAAWNDLTANRFQLPLLLQRMYLRQFSGEREIALLPLLCYRNKTAVDIGCNSGLYTLFLTELTSEVFCFEPLAFRAEYVRRKFVRYNVHVLNMGLSDQLGTAVLQVPYVGSKRLDEWSGFERNLAELEWNGKKITRVDSIEVPIRSLDSFGYENLGFIKVDVEGYEKKVLNGACQTIRRNRPNLVIEIENRHHQNAINEIDAWFLAEKYRGFYYLNGKLWPISEFEVDKLQNHTCADGRGLYINNFVFVPLEGDVYRHCSLISGK